MSLDNIAVLVADDSDITTEMLSFMLAEEGARPVVARNGLEAVKRAQNNDFDVVLMDIQMPECNGIEATRQIRAFNVDVPIIAVSGASHDESEAFSEHGFSDFLQKPVSFPQLIGLIKRYVQS